MVATTEDSVYTGDDPVNDDCGSLSLGLYKLLNNQDFIHLGLKGFPDLQPAFERLVDLWGSDPPPEISPSSPR